MAEAERTGDVSYKYISASGYARQQNGNITNQYARHIYQLRRRTSDSTLRRDQRNTALLTAAAEGQTPRIRHLLDLGVDLDHSDDYGFTALHHAALSGFEDTVEVVLEAGADVNATSLDCGTALHLAALKSRAKIVELLLRYRGNVNRTSRLLGTVVHCAIYAGDEAIVTILEAHKAKLDKVAIVLPSLLRSVSREGDYCPQLPYPRDNHDLPERTADGLLTSDYSGVLECLPFHLATLTGNSNLLKTQLLPSSLIDCHAWNPITLDDEGLSRPSRGKAPVVTRRIHMPIFQGSNQKYPTFLEFEHFGKPTMNSGTARKLTVPMTTGSSALIASQAIDEIAATHGRNDMNADINDENDEWYEATEFLDPLGSESIERQNSETAENLRSEGIKSQVQASATTTSGTVMRDQYDDNLSQIAHFGPVKSGGREPRRPVSARSIALRAEADRLTAEVLAKVNDEQIIYEPSASLQITSSKLQNHEKEMVVYRRAADLGSTKAHLDIEQDTQSDEDKRQAALRASAISMARKMYESQKRDAMGVSQYQSVLGSDGKLSSRSAATTLKYTRPQDLPSFPSNGYTADSSAGKAAMLAKDYKMKELWQPEAANKSGKVNLWEAQVTAAGPSAAALALKNREPISPPAYSSSMPEDKIKSFRRSWDGQKPRDGSSYTNHNFKPAYMNLQETAQKLAAERLAKIDKELAASRDSGKG